ncbi:MAG: protein-L-isoaspartate(D-aspartate) O-methyltransferase [Candidatus Nanoarchaeia archaeon]
MNDKKQNREMIETIKSYGLYDEKIFGAMEKAKRHIFLPEYPPEDVYGDNPLPIGYGQTISQPYTVAFMLYHLELRENLNVLEIGAGSGWNAALIKEIIDNGKVTTIEDEPELAKRAKNILAKLNYDIKVINGNGAKGYPNNAPYDRIIVTCASPKIQSTWIEQLKEGGILVAPIGEFVQTMIKAKKENGELISQKLGNFRFVPLKGAE